MTKKFNSTLALAATGMLCLLSTQPAQAAKPTETDINQLTQQVQLLMQQNEELSQRIAEMEKNIQSTQATVFSDTVMPQHKSVIAQEVSRQVKESESDRGINEYIHLHGAIEGLFTTGEDFAGNTTSEFALDTVLLAFDIKVTDWATGVIVIEYDSEDADQLFIDEAHITVGNTETFPLYLTIGKVYVPFGDFSTNMIQDPLTHSIGEINPEGAIIGFEQNGISAALFAYNGTEDDTDGDTSINGFGASLGYAYETEDMGFNAGIGWVSHIGDSGGISDWFATSVADGNPNPTDSVSDHVDGLSLNLGANYKSFSLIAEYTTALDSFTQNEIAWGNGTEGAEPSAWNTELAYTTAIADKLTVFAVGYQQTWESLALSLPEQRYIAAASMVIFDGTILTLEYYDDEDYSTDDGGTDDSGYGFTTRLAYEF